MFLRCAYCQHLTGEVAPLDEHVPAAGALARRLKSETGARIVLGGSIFRRPPRRTSGEAPVLLTLDEFRAELSKLAPKPS